MAAEGPHAAPQHILQQQLPHGVLECLCGSATPRQRAALSAVCKEWRETVLLSTTSLSVNLKSDAGADSISHWLQQHACQLQELSLSTLANLALLGSRTRRLGFDGVGSLAQLCQLTSLKVERLGIGDDAAVMLARSLTQLLQLSLSGNNIGPAGAAGIARHLTRLQQLDVSVNRIKDAGLSSLCSSLHRLDTLNLSGNIKFAPATLQQLQSLTSLTSLHASSTGLCNQGLAALAHSLQGAPLRVLDAAGNKVSKVDAVTALSGLTSLTLSRNPLQLACSKVLASSLPQLQELILFDALSAKAVGALAGLAPSLTCLTLGCDPGTTAHDAPNLPLSKTRTCSALFSAFAEAGNLQVLSVPCAGLGDAQAKMLARFGPGAKSGVTVITARTSLVALNLGYNSISAEGLGFLRELPQLVRLELRSMRPELTDAAAKALVRCSRLELLDLAFNDFSSEGVTQLGTSGQLARLRHLNLRSNVQVEKSSVIAAAAGLSALTYLNLLELSDVSARPGAAAAAAGGAAGAGGARAGARGGTAGAAAGAGAAGGGAALLHADVWAALPNLQELVVGTYGQGGSAFRSGRLVISCGS
ncbi:hypothetical protein OEZ85_008989 [Tetradesmus obliquus]|uniref:F-box domain-containing protein n=1 Tax=Tetradesmus obliquus TaxID=3088 RepID=A0ABY8TKT4_TETOB|nr:hypothetical protein OEZ85_008989 [Tetradesmus obliquus]